jgi:hypothetical protein
LLARFAARERAKTCHVLRVRLEKNAAAILQCLAKDAGISVLSRPGSGDSGNYALLCPCAKLMDALASLRAQGCTDAVTAQDVEYIFENENPVYVRLIGALDR